MTTEEKIKYWVNLSDEDFQEDLLKETQKLRQWIKERI
jgi:hypothetical protein